jgi:hypothetical protein
MWSRAGTDDGPSAFLGTGPTETGPIVLTGTQDVIARTDSELGSGISIPEIDRLDVRADGANLVTGDNHAIWYYRRAGQEVRHHDSYRGAAADPIV